VRYDQTPLRVLASFAAVLALTCARPGTAHADRLPLLGSGATAPLPAGNIIPSNHLIVPVDPDSVPCSQPVTFNDLVGGENPGTDYDGIVQSGGLSFAERFVGQTLGYNGDFDAVSGIPTSPLSLQVGAPGQNLDVFAYTTNVLAGLGNLGFPDLDAIGEGAIAMYFPILQSRVSFEIVGGNGGSATLGFYRANGSLIDNVVVTGLVDSRYGFATPDGTRSIAGILIQSTDPSGIGVDNICHDGGLVSSRAVTWSDIKRLYR
jgi:hypothetical protein